MSAVLLCGCCQKRPKQTCTQRLVKCCVRGWTLCSKCRHSYVTIYIICHLIRVCHIGAQLVQCGQIPACYRGITEQSKACYSSAGSFYSVTKLDHVSHICSTPYFSLSVFPSPVSLWGVSECKTKGEEDEEVRFNIRTRQGWTLPQMLPQATFWQIIASRLGQRPVCLWPRSNSMWKCSAPGFWNCKVIRS